MKKSSLVSQSVIDASDKLRADTMAKVNADPKLRKIYDDTRKEAQANIDRHKKMRVKRKVDALLAQIDAKIADDPVLQSRCQQVMEDAIASIQRMAKGQRNMERINLAAALDLPMPKLEEL